MSDNTPKFSSSELESCQSWMLPDVGDSDDSMSPKAAINKTATQKQQAVNPANQNEHSEAGESIDTIDARPSPISVEQLSEITEAAEKEGFESGHKEGLEQGKADGREQGYQAGLEEGLTSAQQQINERCEQLQHIIDALMIPLESEQKQLEDVLLNMVTRLTEAVVQRELQQDSSHITRLVDDAIKVLPVGCERFSLFLNPQDIATVEDHLQQQARSEEQAITLHSDENLMPGGCRLETRQTMVDYSVEQRLQTVIEGFLHKRYTAHDEDKQTVAQKPADDPAPDAQADASPLESKSSSPEPDINSPERDLTNSSERDLKNSLESDLIKNPEPENENGSEPVIDSPERDLTKNPERHLAKNPDNPKAPTSDDEASE